MQTASHARKFAKIAHSLYERGFILFAFFAMLFAMAISDSESDVSWRQSFLRASLPDLESNSAADDRRIQHDKDVDWLSTQAQHVTKKLQSNGIANAAVYHRVKSPESAAEKALRKHVQIADLNDLFGMRIVLSNELDVYRTLNVLCHSYELLPGTLKNYIANPKASGYQSIHLVAGLDGRRVEFQLRTLAMHEQSEAEHEAYKQRVRVA